MGRDPAVGTGESAVFAATHAGPPSAEREWRAVRDIELAARMTMPRGAEAFVRSGAGNGVTVAWNRRALTTLRLRPRALVDVARIDTSLNLLGTSMPSPIVLAPAALQSLLHPKGEIEAAHGAAAAGAVFVISTVASEPIEAIARASTGTLWFQLYAQRDWGVTLDLIARAEAAGCRAIMLTVDSPRLERRHWEYDVQMDLRAYRYPNLSPRSVDMASLTWADVKRLRAHVHVPFMLKGLLTSDDARRAHDEGADAVIVSNHGGRTLDTLPPTTDALREVADGLQQRIPLLADGGIRTGTDILKMLALGASAVMIGRPYLYALHAAGAAGVARVLEILQQELESAMALSGRTKLESIDRTVLW